MSTNKGTISSLLEVSPNPSIGDVLSHLVPPREFSKSTFQNYLPNSAFPSQAEALVFAKSFAEPRRSGSLFKRSKLAAETGIYLDGGFGVGKTHLLAAIFHKFHGKKAFGSFLTFTSLIGLLGFSRAVQELSKYELICIDEFELDDPGDTMLMSRLLAELEPRGIRFAATSNTPPNALGQGRFAADNFRREIAAMADRFRIVSVDGEDYRHRPIDDHTAALTDSGILEAAETSAKSGKRVAIDDFDGVLEHLSTIHPSKYAWLIQDIDELYLTKAHVLTDQSAALRFVALVDRLYEEQIALQSSGIGLTEVFPADFLNGGYRKKYLRAISRIGSLANL